MPSCRESVHGENSFRGTIIIIMPITDNKYVNQNILMSHPSLTAVEGLRRVLKTADLNSPKELLK